MDEKKQKKGLETTEKIFGLKRYDLLQNYGALGEYIVENAFGSVYSRKALDLKTRSMLTITLLIGKDTCPKELKSHMEGAINLGVSFEELSELILHCSLYVGIPNAKHAFDILNELEGKNTSLEIKE